MTQVNVLLKQAYKLDLPQRAELVSSLLENLDTHPHHVSDEEVFQRLQELKSGEVNDLSEEDFWKDCGRTEYMQVIRHPKLADDISKVAKNYQGITAKLVASF